MPDSTPQEPMLGNCNRKVGEIFTTVFMLIVVISLVRTLCVVWRAGSSYENIFEGFGTKISSMAVMVLTVDAFLCSHPFLVATLLAMLIGAALFVTWRGNWLAGVIIGAALLIACTTFDLLMEFCLKSHLTDILRDARTGAL
jgi:type II secretory pathway component PulF